jgi:cell division protein FtsB
MLFFDQNSYLNKRKYNKELKQLQKDKEFYLKKIAEDSIELKELKTNNLNLEKFARERYLMKRPNEDIFIIMDETTK